MDNVVQDKKNLYFGKEEWKVNFTIYSNQIETLFKKHHITSLMSPSADLLFNP